MHTCCSDGTFTPYQIVKLAEENHLDAISITDHDTIAGINPAQEIAKNDRLKVIPGIELSTKSTLRMHILGYFININDKSLTDLLDKLARAKKSLLAKTIKRIRETDSTFSPKNIVDAGKYCSATRIKYMLSKEHPAHKRGEFYDSFLEISRAWHEYLLTPEECISIIHRAQGLAVLAHPILLGLTEQKLENVIKDLRNCGLDGIEIKHPEQNVSYQARISKIVTKYGLFETGGSDIHGTGLTSGKYNAKEFAFMISKNNAIYKRIMEIR